MFVNSEVGLESLPRAEAVDWLPLDPRFLRRRLLGKTIKVLVFAAVGAAAHYSVAHGWFPPDRGEELRIPTELWASAWAVFALLSLNALVWPVIEFPRMGYVVRDKDILYRSGVLWRSVEALPFNRVQHTAIHSGPLDRRFGLAILGVFAAGDSQLEVPGLAAEIAEGLRVHISRKIEAEGGEAKHYRSDGG